MAFLPDHRVATLVAGLVTLAAGAAILAIAPRSRLHRAAGLFFGVRGTNLTLLAFSEPFNDLQGRMLVYFLLATPAAAAWLAYHLLQDGGGPRRLPPVVARWTGGLLVLATGILGLMYAADHDLFFRGPLGYVYDLQFVTYSAIAAAIALGMRAAQDGPARRALFTFMLGFLGEPVYWASTILQQWARGVPVPTVAVLLAAFALAVGLGSVPLAGLRRGHKEWTPALALVAVALGTALLTDLQAQFSFAPPYLLDIRELNAAWTLWTVAATAYASLRYRLFVMDLRVKQFVRYGATTFLLGALFFTTSELVESQFDTSNALQGLAAAASIGIALYPLHKLTRRLAERLMPGVADTEEYRASRRREIYRAAVQRARVDGFVDDVERDALRRLGSDLGLSGREMAHLESSGTSA